MAEHPFPFGQEEQAKEFERQSHQRQAGLLRELFSFLANNKKWWLAPIIVVLLLVGILLVLGGTGAAPFIYTLF